MLQRASRRSVHIGSALLPKIDKFGQHVDLYLPKDGKNCVFASAWLATDNMFVALMKEQRPKVYKGLHLVGVDTLHLFPETYALAEEVQKKYGKDAKIYLPRDCETIEDFRNLYGDCEEIDFADFDFASKVEPFGRALTELKKDILITGRRMDQGNERISLPIFEDDKRTFNPLADWSWNDVTTFVDNYGVPVNKRHNIVYRSERPIDARQRHLPDLPWEKVDLGKPFWRCQSEEMKGNSPYVYIFKSFGDLHSSVPVEPHESERAGRFVRQSKTECGIHTRTAIEGAPHGGKLVNLISETKVDTSKCVRNIDLNERQACDVWALVSGAFSPLEGFMTEKTYDSVVQNMRLDEKQLFGLPVTFDVHDITGLTIGSEMLLRWNGEDVAVLTIESIFKPNKAREALNCYGTSSLEHPTVSSMVMEQGHHYVGGKLIGISIPKFDYPTKTPREVRAELPNDGTKVVAFQNRNPIHRAHFELLKRASQDIKDSTLLVHPTCGPTQPGDIDGIVRIDTYAALEAETKEDFPRFKWAYLPYSMKMAGPREAIQHMIIRKNFGATHFIIGRDMAGTKSTISGNDFYGAYDAQEIGKKFSSELGMTVKTYENMVFVGDDKGFLPESEAKAQGLKVVKLSGTEFRRRLRENENIPSWFSFKSVVDILRKAGDHAFCK